jgi:hypothetical protein
VIEIPFCNVEFIPDEVGDADIDICETQEESEDVDEEFAFG